jgi:hypothetical protein
MSQNTYEVYLDKIFEESNERGLINFTLESWGGQGYDLHKMHISGNGHNIYKFILDTLTDDNVFKDFESICITVLEKDVYEWATKSTTITDDGSHEDKTLDFKVFGIIEELNKSVQIIKQIHNEDKHPRTHINGYKILDIIVENENPDIPWRFSQGMIHEYMTYTSIPSINGTNVFTDSWNLYEDEYEEYVKDEDHKHNKKYDHILYEYGHFSINADFEWE